MIELAARHVEALATGLYWACVDFMVHTATLLGVTYRDTNAALFFLIWPAATAILLLVVTAQAHTLARLRARARGSSSPPRPSCTIEETCDAEDRERSRQIDEATG